MSDMYEKYEGKTINFVGGACPFDCIYCYVKSFTLPMLRKRYSGKPCLIEESFKKQLGENKDWFPNSCSDICAVPDTMMVTILKRLNEFPTNTYLIQSKSPSSFQRFKGLYPPKIIFGTTIETNRDALAKIYSQAPPPSLRQYWIGEMPRRMVSIEPIMDFDLDVMVRWMRDIWPEYVSIGADSKGHGLQEPPREKVRALVKELEKFTEVSIKINLRERGLI